MTEDKLDEKNFIRHKLFEDKKSAFAKYSDLVIGKQPFLQLLKYEFITTFISPIPGATGLLLRRMFFPFLFRESGRGVIFGKSVLVRHPSKIFLGNRVVIDDYALLDARGSFENGVITIGDDVFIGRGVHLQSKVGSICIGAQTSIGAGTTIVSQGGIVIGEMVNIGGNCTISGGSYQVGRNPDSDREHEKFTHGPIYIDKKCRLGMGAMVLDGVHIREGTIVGAMSLVTGDLPDYSVAAGIPAKVKYRREEASDNKKGL